MELMIVQKATKMRPAAVSPPRSRKWIDGRSKEQRRVDDKKVKDGEVREVTRY